MKTLKTILLIALTWAATACQAAPVDRDKLASSIEEYLTNNFPSVDRMEIGADARRIAWHYHGKDRFKPLCRGLADALYNDPNFNFSEDGASTAAEVIARNLLFGVPMPPLPPTPPLNPASLPPFIFTNQTSIPMGPLWTNLPPAVFAANSNDFFGPVYGNPESSLLNPPNGAAAITAANTNDLSRFLDFEIGTIILQPFTIGQKNSDDTAPLNNNGVTARFMLSAIFQTRTAWRETNTLAETKAVNWPGENWGNWLEPKDFEIQLGYAFGDSTSAGSAAPGAGDAYGETSLGWNWVKIIQEPNSLKSPIYTVGPEIYGGFSAESSDGTTNTSGGNNGYTKLHYDSGAGLAFVAGFPMSANLDYPKLELMSRIGWAYVDDMSYAGGTNSSMVKVDGVGNPMFSGKSAFQIESEVRIPIVTPGSIGQYGFLSVGGTFYKLYDRGVDTWTMYAAVSIPLETLLGAIPKVSLP